MTTRDKATGAYIGAAIGDAMGGPVECAHHIYIRRTVGEVTDLLPYEEHYTPIKQGREYMRSSEAGAITDDTFIRADVTRFLLTHTGPKTPETFARWLLDNVDFGVWWAPVAANLQRVGRGEVAAADAGLDFMQGGGNGWWTPVGILNAGNWAGAEADVRNLSRIWKRGLEQDLLSATQTGLATAMREGASFEDVVEGILKPCGPLARTLIGRGLAIGLGATSTEDLAERVYSEMLFSSSPDPELAPPDAPDAPLPEPTRAGDDIEAKQVALYFAEQIPTACAAFAYGRGDPAKSITAAVNIGRDCDSTATTVGSWCGAIHGEAALPSDWVEKVCRVNAPHVDIRGLAESLAARLN